MILKWLGGLALVGLLGLGLTFWFVCPCEVVPGGSLAGEMASDPVSDWSFVNDEPLCQVEVDIGLPWSINLNCMSTEGQLYVSCSRCAGKTWSQAALDDPDGYIRVGPTVYPVTLTRLTEPAMLDVAWAARSAKLNRTDNAPRPDHWWSFQLTSR